MEDRVKFKFPILDDFSYLLLDTLENEICSNKLCEDNIGGLIDSYLYHEGEEIYMTPIEIKTIEIVQKYRKEFRDVLQKAINEINSEYIKLKQNDRN